jgi:LmbE family N-acetylglucosaminyl deacetylase
MKNIKKLLVIAAHPDDELLGCGGSIAKYLSDGVLVKVLFLGEGSTCRYDDPFCKEAETAIKKRNLWAIEALSVIGVKDFEFYSLLCGRFDQTPIIVINKIIESVIREFKPDTVFTHSEFDSNNDHRITHRATIMATRPCGEHIVDRLFCYEVLSSSEWSYTSAFLPNYFVSLTEKQLLAKWNALECYATEMRDYPFPRSWLGVKNLAMKRGMQAGFEFAESFQLVRWFDL